MNHKAFKKYKRIILILKYLLITGFIGIISGIFIYVSLNKINSNNLSKNNKPSVVVDNDGIIKQAKNYILKPKIYGVDNKNNPYSIFADEGIQLEPDIFSLKIINATFRDNENRILVSAKKGLINTNQNNAELEDEVVFKYNNDYQLSADFTLLNYKSSSGYGHGRVILSSNTGYITADKFEVTNEFNEIIFFGNRVKTIINFGKNTDYDKVD